MLNNLEVRTERIFIIVKTLFRIQKNLTDFRNLLGLIIITYYLYSMYPENPPTSLYSHP